MNERLNWIFPSVFLGRVFSTDIRVSWWFALVPLIVCPKYHLDLGLTFTVLLFLSIVLHEFAHVLTCRWTGGIADEIHLTPLGGISQLRPGRGSFGIAMTSAAGPVLNLLICLMTFPAWYAPKLAWTSLYPFAMPIARFSDGDLLRDLGVLLFSINWMIFLVNLLPVVPLDGGQILRSILSVRIHPELVQRTALHIGLAVSVVLLIGGAALDISQVVLIGTFVLMINVIHLLQEEMGDAMDDSGYGFEFSSSFETVESINPTVTRQSKLGLLQRWRERRRMRREQQERIRRLEAEQQLDMLLAKVHESGLGSLSEQEKKSLRSCSELLKPRFRNAE